MKHLTIAYHLVLKTTFSAPISCYWKPLRESTWKCWWSLHEPVISWKGELPHIISCKPNVKCIFGSSPEWLRVEYGTTTLSTPQSVEWERNMLLQECVMISCGRVRGITHLAADKLAGGSVVYIFLWLVLVTWIHIQCQIKLFEFFPVNYLGVSE